jgi:CHAD domain-containing protein
MMEFAFESLTRPLRKLRQLIKGFPDYPSPGEVHELRTQARRLEAVLDAVTPDFGERPKRLRQIMTPVRKAAGGVRDMDVMLGNVLRLTKTDRSTAVVRLVTHLAEVREKRTRHLHNIIAKQGKKARVLLKRYARLIEKQANSTRPAFTGSAAAAQAVIVELDSWPTLDSQNLHAFRIRVKNLRYLLQLSHSASTKGMKILAKAKDAIGEWHDWRELLKIAQKVLDPKADRAMLNRVEVIGDRRYRTALASASLLHKQDLDRMVSTDLGPNLRRRKKTE